MKLPWISRKKYDELEKRHANLLKSSMALQKAYREFRAQYDAALLAEPPPVTPVAHEPSNVVFLGDWKNRE